MVIVSLSEEVVITLSVLRGEHGTDKGHVGLVAEDELTALDVQIVTSSYRCGEPDGCPCLCGVVTVAVVVEEPYVGSHQSTGREAKVGQEVCPVVVPTGIEAQVCRYVVSGVSWVLCLGVVRLGHGLEGDAWLTFQWSPGVQKQCGTRSFVLQWREVGVVLTGATDAEQEGAGRAVLSRQWTMGSGELTKEQKNNPYP